MADSCVARDPDGRVVLFDGIVRVRIDPAALPAASVGSDLALPAPTVRSTLGAVRDWCEPRVDADAPEPGSICGVALDPAQAWWTLGQILAPLPDSTRIGLARVDVGRTPAVVVTGEGWDVLIAGLDPGKLGHVPEVPLAMAPLLRLVRKEGADHA